ncbi:MAG: transglycosylase domain-containing protein, partial [Lachnospiraceae bacterium]|nr:transglycosylase domain-containing protein [Lachnospiraceae bacterium]
MDYGKRGVKKRQARLQAVGPRWGNKFGLFAIELIIIAVIGVGIMGAAAGIGMFKAVLDNSPTPDPNDVAPSGYSTFVYDAEGNQIAKLVAQNSNRIPITQDKVTDNLAHAFVAIEDKNFYVHNGIDISGIGRAIYKFIMSGFKTKQGASTIPQQLLKNTVFTGWMEEDGLSDQIKRKIQEQYLALELSKVLSKDEILLRYLNTINLGQNTLGVQAASQRYFNKDVSELTISECAVIAGITKNPSKYNPISNPEANAGRREDVLKAMLDCGYITKDQYEEAMADDVYSRIQAANQVVEKNETTSYFVDALTDQLYKDLLAAGYSENTAYSLLYSGGLKIYSTQDSNIQRIMDSVMTNEENFPANTDWLLSYQLTLTLPDGTSQNFSTEMLEKYFKENEDRGFDLLFPSKDEAREKADQYKELMMAEYNAEFQGERISITAQPQISMVLMNQHNGEV